MLKRFEVLSPFEGLAPLQCTSLILPYPNGIPIYISGLVLNVLVVICFAERLYRKSPSLKSYRSWNLPRKYEFNAFISMIFQQTIDFWMILYGCYHPAAGIPAYMLYWVAECNWALASLYRYQRILLYIPGTPRFKGLQIFKQTIICSLILSNVIYIIKEVFANKIIRDDEKQFIMEVIDRVFQLLNSLLCAGTDLYTNVEMTRNVLATIPRKDIKIMQAFRFKLKFLVAIEVLIAFLTIFFFMLQWSLIYVSIICIPMYVSFTLLEILRDFAVRKEAKECKFVETASTDESVIPDLASFKSFDSSRDGESVEK